MPRILLNLPTILTVVALGMLLSCRGGSSSGDSSHETVNDETSRLSRFPYDADYPVTDSRVLNPTAYITSQCYTKTTDENDNVHNPCYSCHTTGKEPNYVIDSDLQTAYRLPGPALVNPWSNLFLDRSNQVDALSDQEILDYVRTSNYIAEDGSLILADLLHHLPANWDLHGDGQWNGYIPDSYFDFDAEGFDRDPSGGYTGWRAFAYYPFLGTFWPTNGSTDDVLIRLGAEFRENDQGVFDLRIYKINLAIVEALIKQHDIPIDVVNEQLLGVDLDKDGVLASADHITYDWAPAEGRNISFVGRARELQNKGQVTPAAGLFPMGSEFLHSVRYIDPLPDGSIAMAARMKELRYARKVTEYPYYVLEQAAQQEVRERVLDPDAIRQVSGDIEKGMFTQGWRYQGFIEDRNGDLRPQTKEESLFCMGCHSGIGATTDTVFSFSRKFGDTSDTLAGWSHWSQQGLTGVADPQRPDGVSEYAHYLVQNGAGDEFRANEEVLSRFFDADGKLRQDALDRLKGDISYLLYPSRERAMLLNKAYRVIVAEQSFVGGRDAHVAPLSGVHQQLEQNVSTGVTAVDGVNAILD
ncbi:MAG: hypothetical protein P8179_08785 [Candidatus Thiodiazotropha sp.]